MYISAARILLATLGLSSRAATSNNPQTDITMPNSTELPSNANEPPRHPILPTTPHNEVIDFSTYNSTYSFDSDQTHNPKWMSYLPSSTNLTSLSIPGTHNTMTYDISAIYQCQNVNLTTQLESGIRYLDIRARVVDNELVIYHGNARSIHSFTEVLLETYDFLDRNPGEVIMMRVKEEVGVATNGDNSDITFTQAFSHSLQTPETKPGLQKHIWLPETTTDLYTVPPLGELRGKILILQDFGDDTAQAEYGINWGSPLLQIEDAYDVPEKGGKEMKRRAVGRSLREAREGIESGDGGLYLTYLSGGGGVGSLEVAAGEGGVNDWVGEWIVGEEVGKWGLGVVAMDVPGKRLIEAVLGRNPVGREESDWSGLQFYD